MTARRNLMVILLVLMFAPNLHSAEPPVKAENTTPIEICPSCTAVRILLVYDMNSKFKTGDDPKVEAAYFNGAATRNAAKFSAKWVGQPFPRAIEIALDENETIQAGTYDLYLNLQPGSDPSAGRLKVQLVRPAASLEAIPKLIIDRTCGIIGRADSHPALRVTETSKKSRITNSRVRPVSNSVLAGRPIGGTLVFSPTLPEIRPGDQVTLDYTLDGSFGMGTATGTMKIEAPQLASPVSFEFEVRSRVHWIWIGLTVIVALVISWLVKVKLQQKIELGQAMLDAEKLVERIAREAQRHTDPDFAKTYCSALDELTTAMKNRIATDINKYKLELDTKWQTALKEHEKKHQDEQEALEKLRLSITGPNWLVPPVIVEAVVKGRKGVGDTAQLVKDCRLKEAGEKRAATITELGDDIREDAATWQDVEEATIKKMIENVPKGIPSSISAWLTQSATNLFASLHKVDRNARLETIEDIHRSLEDLKIERSAAKAFFDQLSSAMVGICETASGKIPDPPPANWRADAFTKAPKAVKELATFLKKMVDNPNEVGLQAELKSVHQAWTDALQGQFTTPNGPVEAQLEARDYVQATVEAVLAVQGTSRSYSVGPGQPSSAQFLLPPFYPDMASAGPPIYANYTMYQTVTTPAPAVPTTITAAKELAMDKGIQSGIVGALLILAGYGLQLNTFVGTFTDFSTLFFWAFALDLTVDQVRSLTKKT